MDMMLRFLIGGTVVSVFAILGDVVKPESLGGVFAAAPTIALGTLVLTMHKHGGGYVATEARSMVAGAVAFFAYACVVSFVLMRWRPKALTTAIALWPLWFATASALGRYGCGDGVMRLKLKFDSLKETRPIEYVSRFVFGGVVTVLAGIVAEHYGPVLGGLFLAFPGIFPAGVSLVEKHKTLREQAEGKLGIWSGRGQAGAEATGASVGTLGLMGFALVLWQGLPTHNFLPMIFAATGTWVAVSALFWWTRERM